MEPLRTFQNVITKHYADFSGRARPAEFWWFMLVFFVIDVALAFIQHGFTRRPSRRLSGSGCSRPRSAWSTVLNPQVLDAVRFAQ